MLVRSLALAIPFSPILEQNNTHLNVHQGWNSTSPDAPGYPRKLFSSEWEALLRRSVCYISRLPHAEIACHTDFVRSTRRDAHFAVWNPISLRCGVVADMLHFTRPSAFISEHEKDPHL